MADASLSSRDIPLAKPAASADPPVPRRSLARRGRGWSMWLIIAGLLVWSWAPTEMSRATALFTDWRNMAEFGRAFLHPDFSDWDSYLADMIVTVKIAL